MLPTSAPVTQEFGSNFLINGRWAYPAGGHNGMDFGASTGSVVVAPANLTILSYAEDSSGFGRLMKGRDAYGYTHWFAHLLSPLVGVGTQVLAGQAIAVTDNTGFSTAPHLHWGVQLPGYSGYNGYVNPRNWPGFSQTDMATFPDLQSANHANKVEAIRGFIFRITSIIHSDADIAKNHLGTDATLTAAERKALADKFFDPTPGSEYMNAGVQAYTDEYGKGDYVAEVAKKARAQVGIPQLREELMRNPASTGQYEPVNETLYKKK